MTILSANEIWSGQTGSDEKSGAVSYETEYQIISDTPTELITVVASVLPALGTAYAADPKATVENRSISRRSDTREVWEATVTYSYDPKDPDEYEEDPTQEPAKIRWTSSLEVEPIFKDRADKAIVNSAGDYFDPPIEYPIARWQVNVQKNVAVVPVGILDLAGSISSASYTVDGVSVEARKSRLVALEISDEQERNDITFRTITMGIEFSKDEYLVTPLDQGYRIKDGTTLKDILIADEDGNEQRPSAPVLLDGSGAKLANPNTDNAVFLEFDPPVPEFDFNNLPLA